MEGLYKEAKESIKRYQESGEELDDFDAFMDEVEKEMLKEQHEKARE